MLKKLLILLLLCFSLGAEDCHNNAFFSIEEQLPDGIPQVMSSLLNESLNTRTEGSCDDVVNSLRSSFEDHGYLVLRLNTHIDPTGLTEFISLGDRISLNIRTVERTNGYHFQLNFKPLRRNRCEVSVANSSYY